MSLRMSLAGALMRLTVRPMMARASDPVPLRRHLELSARLWFRNVPFAHYSKVPFGSAGQALWVSAGVPHRDQVILYLHGGGYIAGSPATHRRMVARLAGLTGCRVFLPAYRLAPEHPLPTALEDAEAAHRHLLDLGYAPDQILIGGDSAGGGLALSLLAQLCQRDLAPRACFAWSPLCDHSYSGDSVMANGHRDHFFPGDRVQDLAAMVLGRLSPEDPRASPLFAQFPNCPPVLLKVSDSEILRDDAHRMAAHLRTHGSEVLLQEWLDAPHVWQIFDGWFPEARAAISATADFIIAQCLPR